jgi:serine/threonine protein phosphatase PrpC
MFYVKSPDSATRIFDGPLEGPILAPMTTAEQVALVLTDEDMTEPRLAPTGAGRAVVFSARAPDKNGPNEDSGGVLTVDSRTAVLAVADGMGGQPAGESASKITMRCLRKTLEQAAESGPSVRGAILDALERANERIIGLGIGAATTFAALEIAGDTLRPYHVGDSGILVVGQRGKLKLQTIPHSPVGYAVEAGLLDEHEAMHHDDRHLVSNTVGSPDMRIEVGSALELAVRDTALLATDGLFDNLNPSEVVEIVRAGPLEQAAAELARLCSERMREPLEGHPSKPDDLTFLLYRRHAD